jgi:hypothetical protein
VNRLNLDLRHNNWGGAPYPTIPRPSSTLKGRRKTKAFSTVS